MRMSVATLMWPLMLCGALVTLAGITPVAMAGLATTPLALNDGFGPAGGQWRGSVSVAATLVGDDVGADLEWAAFAPGKFQLYLNAEHPGAVDPSAGTEVIYAYEIVDISAADPGIDLVTVGVDATDIRGSIAPTWVGLTGGLAPSNDDDQTTSMMWEFLDPSLGLLDKSPILVFSSPMSPEFDFINISSGVASQFPPPLVASISDRIFQNEVPEPAVVSLVAIAIGLVFGVRRRL
jgi:hypothetical protein